MQRTLRVPAGYKREDFYSRLVFDVPKAMKDEIRRVAREENTCMSVIVREAITEYLSNLRYRKVV